MREFRKKLRLAIKADKHFWRNNANNHRPESIEHHEVENMQQTMIRKHKNGTTHHKTKFPKGELWTKKSKS